MTWRFGQMVAKPDMPPPPASGTPLGRAAHSVTSHLRGYAPALIALAICIGLHYLTVITFGPKTAVIFFIYLMALLISAWCGYGPGILVLAAIATGVPFLFQPDFSIRKVNLRGVSVLLLISLIISRTAESRRRAEAALRDLNDELDSKIRQQTRALEEANTILHHRLAELETLYAQLSVGLCFLDTNLRFVRINEKLAAINGASVADHEGRKLGDMLPRPLADLVEPIYRGVLDSGVPVLDHEIRSPASASMSDEFWSISCTPVNADNGARLGVQVIVQNITERKLAEQALTKANTALRRANEDLEDFAYSASHDLQEPLRMVAIYSQMLRKKFGGKLGAAGDEYIGYTMEGAVRMEQLVRGLLAYTRASSLNPHAPTMVDANEAMKQALSNLGTAATESGASITRTELPSLPIHRVHLEQLLQNIIGNALKYRRPEPPRVSVTAEERAGEWLFSITDNGIGIDPRYQQQIFGIFKRLHTSGEYAGTGMGLAICERIVHRYGGRIWVESQLGKGSTFFFTLPAGGVNIPLQERPVHTTVH
jgi:PAS domain S-box-containing protein